jgi:predicted transcriptional regulator
MSAGAMTSRMRTSEEILSRTLEGLALAVQVRHIATTPLCPCLASDSVKAVLEADAWKSYSQIPVRDGDHICGVLERAGCKRDGTVRDALRILDESILIAAGAPLIEFLDLAAGSAYRLVVDGGKVDGIVTRSDLQKLPVRVVVFTLVTNLELLMADVIRARAVDSLAWNQCLNENRQKIVKVKFDKLSGEDFDLDELTCTDFCDKRTILKSMLGDLPESFNKDLKEIEELRNSVYHAGEYAQDRKQLTIFLDRLQRTRRWTGELQRQLNGRARNEEEAD